MGQFHLQISLKLQCTLSYLWVEMFKKFMTIIKKIFEGQQFFTQFLLRKQKSIYLALQTMKTRPCQHFYIIIPTQGFLFPVISCSKGWEGNISWGKSGSSMQLLQVWVEPIKKLSKILLQFVLNCLSVLIIKLRKTISIPLTFRHSIK